jgi:hypothetical protein
MEFYKKHIFLFNENCNKAFQKNILPHIKTTEGLCTLFKNESLIIKKLIYDFEEEVSRDLNLVHQLNTQSNTNMNEYFEKIRRRLLEYIAKLANHYLILDGVTEIFLRDSNIGREGAIILSLLVKFNKYIQYIDLSRSCIADKDLDLILCYVQDNPDYFTIDLTGIPLSVSCLKFINIIKKNDFKKEILHDSALSQVSKGCSKNNSRTGKIKVKKIKKYDNIFNI